MKKLKYQYVALLVFGIYGGSIQAFDFSDQWEEFKGGVSYRVHAVNDAVLHSDDSFLDRAARVINRRLDAIIKEIDTAVNNWADKALQTIDKELAHLERRIKNFVK